MDVRLKGEEIMSVIFTTIANEFIILCADRQRTSSVTGEVQVDAVTKVQKLSPEIAIGRCGNLGLCEIIFSAVQDFLKNNENENLSIEDLADLFCQYYHIVRDENNDILDNIVSIFILAGKLSSNKLGAIIVTLGNNTTDTKIVESSEIPVTIILEPPDVSSEECNQLFNKATTYIKKNNKYHQDLLEATHQKAVRYVSEQSKYVGYKSDYVCISSNNI